MTSNILLSNSSSPMCQAILKNGSSLSPYVYSLEQPYPNQARIYSSTRASNPAFGRTLSFPVSRYGLWSNSYIEVEFSAIRPDVINTATKFSRYCAIQMIKSIQLRTSSGKILLQHLPMNLEHYVESCEPNLRDAYGLALLKVAGNQEGASTTDIAPQDDIWGLRAANGGAIKVQIPLSGLSIFSDSKVYLSTNYVENVIVDVEFHNTSNWVSGMKDHDGTSPVDYQVVMLNATLEQEFIQLEPSVSKKFLSLQFPLSKQLVVLLENDENLLTVPDSSTDIVISRSFGKHTIASSSFITNLIIGVQRTDTSDPTDHQWSMIKEVIISASGNTILKVSGRTANLMLNSHRASYSASVSNYSYKLDQSSRLVQIPFKSIVNSKTQFSSGISLRNISDFSIEVSYYPGTHTGSGKGHVLRVNSSRLVTLSQSSATGKISTSLNI
jgi:hypothetical protein